jgi:hypothetical protein
MKKVVEEMPDSKDVKNETVFNRLDSIQQNVVQREKLKQPYEYFKLRNKNEIDEISNIENDSRDSSSLTVGVNSTGIPDKIPAQAEPLENMDNDYKLDKTTFIETAVVPLVTQNIVSNWINERLKQLEYNLNNLNTVNTDMIANTQPEKLSEGLLSSLRLNEAKKKADKLNELLNEDDQPEKISKEIDKLKKLLASCKDKNWSLNNADLKLISYACLKDVLFSTERLKELEKKNIKNLKPVEIAEKFLLEKLIDSARPNYGRIVCTHSSIPVDLMAIKMYDKNRIDDFSSNIWRKTIENLNKVRQDNFKKTITQDEINKYKDPKWDDLSHIVTIALQYKKEVIYRYSDLHGLRTSTNEKSGEKIFLEALLSINKTIDNAREKGPQITNHRKTPPHTR